MADKQKTPSDLLAELLHELRVAERRGGQAAIQQHVANEMAKLQIENKFLHDLILEVSSLVNGQVFPREHVIGYITWLGVLINRVSISPTKA